MRRRCRVKLFNYINGTNGPLLVEQVNTWIERIERDFPGVPDRPIPLPHLENQRRRR
jgi:hypothetical protein